MSPDPVQADVSTIPYRVGLLETALLTETQERRSGDTRLHERVDIVETKWIRLEGAFSLVKFALGTSVVSMVLGLAAILALLSGLEVPK